MSDQPSEASRPPEKPRGADTPRPPEPPAAAEAAGTPAANEPGPSEARTAGATPADTARPSPAQASDGRRQRAQAAQQAGQPGSPWQHGAGAPAAKDDGMTARLRPPPPPLIRPAVLGSVLATALLSALFLSDGLGVNLLIVAVPASLAAFFAAQAAGRRLRPWTATWAVGGLALLAVPALRDAGWPTFLAVVSAFALGSLALHGSRSWPGVLIGSLGLFDSVVPGIIWGVRGYAHGPAVPGRTGVPLCAPRRWPSYCWWSSEPSSPARTPRSPNC